MNDRQRMSPQLAMLEHGASTEVWTARASGSLWTGQLRCLGGAGWECVLWRDEVPVYSQQFESSDEALFELEEHRGRVRSGWL